MPIYNTTDIENMKSGDIFIITGKETDPRDWKDNAEEAENFVQQINLRGITRISQ